MRARADETTRCDARRAVEPLVTRTSTLNEGIAKFYDESSELWERVWGSDGGDGTHMHHGYYRAGEPIDHAKAQVDMIEESLKFAGVEGARRVLDVGCGIGGSSRHMVRKWDGCAAEGVTLSPVQAARANALAIEQGVEDRANYRVADALNTPFEDASFDFVWSMESGEHMPDKKKFVDELARVCEPGGTILIVTWCHRVLKDGETELEAGEKILLDRICDAYYLPAWCSVADYESLAKDAGLVDIRTADWSEEVKPFWKGVIKTALTPRGIIGLIKSGAATLRGALVMPLMQTGLATGTIKFNVIVARKPI
ncbi:gamma-tocopherol methyltransferase [Ostreococcus tauri]|uniref:Gamma-tocopherol methyltransferase n=1 Tax=Ostreococcus tauri TaxID=70448 RepID=A0A1Y5I3W9_OSTTA|nr:gamma-tocopherol methyltransferase [Ostreococcus tauri]